MAWLKSGAEFDNFDAEHFWSWAQLRLDTHDFVRPTPMDKHNALWR